MSIKIFQIGEDFKLQQRVSKYFKLVKILSYNNEYQNISNW